VVAISPFSLASNTDPCRRSGASASLAKTLGVPSERPRRRRDGRLLHVIASYIVRQTLVPDAAGSATKYALKALRAFDYAKRHGQTTSFG
jgi:hypothetical protein